MNLFQFFLIIHIISGFTALFSAPVAMLVKKGSSLHRLWGKIYFWGMTLVFVTSIILSIIKLNLFLGIVGVFSYYFVVMGYRSIYRRNVNSWKDVSFIDWVISITGAVFNLGLLILGVLILRSNPWHALGITAVVLSALGLLTVIQELVRYNIEGYNRKNWMYNHMTGMIGGYIATVSAFSVVNFTFLPGVVQWLWPTAVGVPLMLFWIRSYKSKKSVS